MAKQKKIPKTKEEYTVKYKFTKDEVDINEIIKKSFANKLSILLTK